MMRYYLNHVKEHVPASAVCLQGLCGSLQLCCDAHASGSCTSTHDQASEALLLDETSDRNAAGNAGMTQNA